MKTRREFLLTIPMFLIACSQKAPSPEEARRLREEAERGNDLVGRNLIGEGHPIAKTFKYVRDGTTASANLHKSKQTGIPPEQQLCNTCLYYKKIGDDYGSCQMLPQANVTSNGWCLAWAKIQNQTPANENS